MRRAYRGRGAGPSGAVVIHAVISSNFACRRMASEIGLNALMSSLSFWENAGYVSLALVCFGVAGEFIHDFVPSLKQRSPWWDSKGGKAAVLVLIAALAAELITQAKTNSVSGQIIAFLGDEEAKTREHAAKIDMARVTLETKLAARRIGSEQRGRIASELRPFGIKNIRVLIINGSMEAQDFRRDLVPTFSAAGIHVDDPENEFIVALALPPLSVSAGQSILPFGKAIVAALKKEGVIGASEDVPIRELTPDIGQIELTISRKAYP
jgi:hypothetical protein